MVTHEIPDLFRIKVPFVEVGHQVVVRLNIKMDIDILELVCIPEVLHTQAFTDIDQGMVACHLTEKALEIVMRMEIQG